MKNVTWFIIASLFLPFALHATTLRPYRIGWGYVYVDMYTGKIVLDSMFQNANHFNDGLASVQISASKKWGCIDSTGKFIIPAVYEGSPIFREGISTVKKGDKYGVIDRAGKELVPFEYDDACSCSGGIMAVKKGKKWGGVDTKGNEVIPFKFESPFYFYEGLALVTLKGKQGYIDNTGEVVIPFEKMDNAYGFSSGLAAINKDNEWSIINKAGNKPFEIKCEAIKGFFHEGLIGIKIDGKFGFIDTTGKLVIPAQFDDVDYFSEGLAFVKKTGSPSFIDRSGHSMFSVPIGTSYAMGFKNGMAMYSLNRKDYFIDKKGSLILPDSIDREEKKYELTKWEKQGTYKLACSFSKDKVPDITIKVSKAPERGPHFFKIEGLGDGIDGGKGFIVELSEILPGEDGYYDMGTFKVKETEQDINRKNGISGKRWGQEVFIGKEKFYIQLMRFSIPNAVSLGLYYETEGETDYNNKYNYRSSDHFFYGNKIQ